MLQSTPVSLSSPSRRRSANAARAAQLLLPTLGCITLVTLLTACGGPALESSRIVQNKAKDTSASTAEKLHEAIDAGDVAQVRQRLNQRADPNQPVGPDEDTAMHAAVREGNEDILNLIMSKGGKTDALNARKKSPLMVAVEMGRLPLVKILVSGGADINEKGPGHITPLMQAALKNRLQVIRFLVESSAQTEAEDGRQRTVLFYGAEGADEETMKYLLTLGLDVNAHDRQGQTPLMEAARTNNADAIRAMVAEGADINNPKNDKGRTALDIARNRKSEDAEKALLELGAKP
ncbi:hypothetical protein DB346_07455 [Verrucomicrobia bacterium LW23]|nr:hypothetical protein DB346_07455 [Verrucomicrobia bacterium LW23]